MVGAMTSPLWGYIGLAASGLFTFATNYYSNHYINRVEMSDNKTDMLIST